MGDLEEDLVGDHGAFDSFGGLAEEGESDGQDQQRRNDESLKSEHLEVQLMVFWLFTIVFDSRIDVVAPSRWKCQDEERRGRPLKSWSRELEFRIGVSKWPVNIT